MDIQFFLKMEKALPQKEITYNFSTKKGIIKDVRTQEGESYILGDKVKKRKMIYCILLRVDIQLVIKKIHIFQSGQKKLKLYQIKKI